MQGHPAHERIDPTATKASGGGRRRRTALLAGMAMVLALAALVAQSQAALPLTPVPTFTTANDENGADDQPGQKDLSLQGVATPSPGDLWTTWQWDVTSLSGGNTGDACSLFDTDSDSKINFAVCVTIGGKPAAQLATSPRVYTCGNGKVDRCTSTYAEVTPINTACSVNTNASDPFHAGEKDTQALCHIDLADVGGATTAKLVNTCSYPSEQPTSAPSDCVLIPRDAFVTIQKIATPNSGTFPFRLGTGTPSANPVEFTANGSQTSAAIAIRSGIAYSLKEDVPANWAIDTPAPACTGASGTGTSNGTFSGDTISNIKAASDNVITCVFRDKQLTGAIRITKERSGGDVKLDGAHFTIDDTGDHVTGSGTNAAGTVCVEGLTIGNHTVTETAAPNGHDLATPASQTVNVDAAGTCASGAKTATFDNPVVNGSITVNKFDEQEAPLAGAVWALYNDNADVLTFDANDTDTGKTCTATGTTGQCEFEDVAPGDYIVVEVTPPNGYVEVEPEFVTVGIGDAPGIGDDREIDIANAPADGKIAISKTGFGGEPLDDVTFELFKDSPFGFITTGDTCTTGDDGPGACSFDGLAPGNYLLKEIVTPDGYETHADIPVEVAIGDEPGEGTVVELDVENEVVPGRIEIKKRGVDGTALEGAIFTLYVDNDVVGEFDDQTDTPTGQTCSTDANGDCDPFTGLTPGNYIAVETTTPDGYDTADPEPFSIGIGQEDPSGEPNVGDTDSAVIDDPVVPGTVKITKTSDAGGPLGGATFTLHRDLAPTGGSLDAGGVTDPATAFTCTTGETGAGLCEFTEVPLGDYWIVETDAPDGYDAAAPKAITVGVGDEAPHVGDVVERSFVDARQHRVVVLVCHEGSDTLFSRDVTINGVPTQSLADSPIDGVTEKELCDLGGASVGNISGHGSVPATVDLDSGP